MAAVWTSPHASALTGGNDTWTGTVCARSGLPSPSWPHSASPQVYTPPYTERTAACERPAQTHATGVPCSDEMYRGTKAGDVRPSPSWPSSPAPHE